MAHDWSGLLGEIEAFSARRAFSLLDEDEELCRRRAIGTAMSGEEPQRRFVAKGIASKASRSAVSASERTIASILQAPRSSQQGVIALVGALDASGKREDDEELQKSAGGGGGGASFAAAPLGTRPLSARVAAKDRTNAETASHAAIAAGGQPVVIKVTSTV